MLLVSCNISGCRLFVNDFGTRLIHAKVSCQAILSIGAIYSKNLPMSTNLEVKEEWWFEIDHSKMKATDLHLTLFINILSIIVIT